MLPTGLERGATFSPFVPLLWLACICVPPRPTTQDDWEGMSSSALVHLGEVAEGGYQYQLLEVGRRKSTPTTTTTNIVLT